MRVVRTMLSALIGVAAVPTVVLTASAAVAAPSCVDVAPGQAEAQSMARRCGAQVEVLGLRTETTRVLVQPDGTATAEIYALPQRARRADGSWSALDSTLARNADGTWSPRASVMEVVFSGGGDGALATGRRDGAGVSLTWPGRLPAPTVSGNRATYPEALPGVDLVVTASGTGFSEVLVVKDRQAARNPALRKLAFGTRQTGTRKRELDLSASSPRMWDSSARKGDGVASTVDGPGEGARTADIALESGNGQLTLSPDASLLDSADAAYPLYLDPTISYTNWAMISSSFPTQQYFNYDKQSCSQIPNKDCAKVGSYDVNYRSMFNFPTSSYTGKQIISAKLTLDLIHSASCSNKVTQVRLVSDTGLSTSTTWNSNSGKWSSTVYGSVSNQSCNDARKLTEFDLTGLITTAASSGWDKTILGLRSDVETINATTSSPWKKFDATTAKLVVALNNPPAMPDQLTVDGKPCATGSARPFIATPNPTLRAHVYDADGDTMDAWFAWAKWNGSAWVDEPGGGKQASVASNAVAFYNASGNVDGGVYNFRVQSNDSPSRTPSATSPLTTANCEWETDLVDPVAPTVTGDVYTSGCQPCGSVGQTGRFTFTSSADVVSYKWGWTSPPTNVVNAPSLGAAASIDWTPPAGGARTLHVQAVDRAGRTASTTYTFTVASPTNALALWRLNDAAGPALADDTGNGRALTASGGTLGEPGRMVPGADGVSRSSMRFNGTTDYASRADFLDTSKSFTVSTWVRLNAKSTADQTFLCSQGVSRCSFYLMYDGTNDKWMFDIPSVDQGSPNWYAARSTSTPQVGVWTLLTAVYDSAAHTMVLYVNGKPEGTNSGVAAVDVSGVFKVGDGMGKLNGWAAEAQVWNRALQANEAADLYDPAKVSLVGDWSFGEAGSPPDYLCSNAFDSSPLVHDYTCANGASIPATGGHTGTAISFDGVDDYATTDGPVLHANQSFTLSVWAKVNVRGADQAIVTQVAGNGTSAPPFVLLYDWPSDKWAFTMTSAATNPNWQPVYSTSVATVGSWVHLVVVYDAQAATATLWVDGVQQGAARTGMVTWQGTGPMQLGSRVDGGQSYQLNGSVDELKVWQGVVANPGALS